MKRAPILPLAATMSLALAACNGGVNQSAQSTAPTTTSASSTPSPRPKGATARSHVPTTTTTPASLQTAFESVKSGVVRLEVARCGAGVGGSGFTISSTLVVTAAHVVQDGEVIRLTQGTKTVAGTVIGLNQGADVALVKTAAPLSGAALAFADTPPKVGDPIGAIGFPEGDPLTFNIGTVSGLDRKEVVDGASRHDLIEFDADANHGSSGGPVINPAGQVVGLVDAAPEGEPGRRFAVSSATAQPLVAAWQVEPDPMTPPVCATIVGPDGEDVPSAENPDSTSQQAISTLNVYFDAINQGDFQTAYAQLAEPGEYQAFKAALTSSDDTSIKILTVANVQGSPTIWVSFISEQDPGQGPSARPLETCTAWSLDYVFAKKNGLWLIASVGPHTGVPENAPCPQE